MLLLQSLPTFQEGLLCPTKQPAWSSYRDPSFGHGRLFVPHLSPAWWPCAMLMRRAPTRRSRPACCATLLLHVACIACTNVHLNLTELPALRQLVHISATPQPEA